MEQPLPVQRDGVAPRHRPPLTPARTDDEAAGLAEHDLAATTSTTTPADREGGQRRRRRAGSTAKSGKIESPARAGAAAAGPGASAAGGGGGAAAASSVHATPPLPTLSDTAAAPPAGADVAAGTRFVQQRRPTAAAQSPHLPPPSSSSSSSSPAPPLPSLPAAANANSGSVTPLATYHVPAGAPANYRPASMKPPLSRVPTFPLVDAYVPDSTSNDRRHPRQLVPKDLGFPTQAMHGKIRKEDLDDRLLMATCAVLHGFENRALCPKEVAEVMLERDWLKNAGTTPFAHVSTCIRAHIARAAGASPPYLPLLTPFELVGALAAEEVRAVGLHAEQRPAVKRGTLWYLNAKVFGPGVGADDPFVRCRREAGLAPSDRDGLYVRGLVPLQTNQPAIPPDLRMSSSIFHSNGADDGEGDEEGMGRGKRKRRASSAMMAAMSTTPAGPSPLSQSVGPGTPSPLPIPAARVVAGTPGVVGSAQRRTQSFAGPSSAPARSGIPRLKLRLTALEEIDSGVDDSDGHTGEAAERRRKNKKKTRRAGSEGLHSRAGSTEPPVFDDDDDGSFDEDDLMGVASPFPPRPSAFSSASSSALLAQSLLAAATPDALPRSQSYGALIVPGENGVISPDSLSLSSSSATSPSFPFTRPTASSNTLSAGGNINLSMSAPNIFSHHFANAPSPPDVVMDVDSAAPSPPNTGAGASPASDAHTTTDEDDFHEAMLRGDDLLDFEWGSESYTSTAGTSSIEASTASGGFAAPAAPPSAVEAEGGAPLKAEEDLAAGLEAALKDSTAQQQQQQQQQAQAEVDTPATTPRSPGKEFDEPAAAMAEGEKDKAQEKGKGKEVDDSSAAAAAAAVEVVGAKDDEPVEIVPGPLGTISRVGMSTTLCGEMTAPNSDEDGAEEDGVVIVVEDEEEEINVSVADVSLTSLVHDTPPSVKHSPRSDLGQLIAPPPSPLPLEFNSMGVLTNAFAATDFDFVGHDEAERSPFFRGSSFPYQHDGDSADDEEEEDDIITVKIEEDDHHPALSRVSTAYSSAAHHFDGRLLAGVRAASTGSSSSDSDSFDPMTFVSAPMLATGLPVPQAAPSPPETADWSHGVDMLDDLESELAGVDLMAPESIGLDELDLAWAGGEDDDGPSPPPPTPSRPRLTIPRSGSASSAFLTGSVCSRFTSPIPSPRRSSAQRLPTLADFGKKGPSSPVPPTLTRTSSATTVFSASRAATPRHPVEGAEAPAEGDDEDEVEDERDDDEDEDDDELNTPPPPRRTTRARRPSAAVKASTATVEADAPPTTPRKSRRVSAAAAAAAK
ncbi:hypothetical protein JCM6882_009570 [Rhodosporidiobolus microsporus]